eukprot:3430470-Pyramimonas_sp.AAC.1
MGDAAPACPAPFARGAEELRQSQTASSTASTAVGNERMRVGGALSSRDTQQTNPGRLWISGGPRAVLEVTRRATWGHLAGKCHSQPLAGTTAKFAKTSQSFSVHFTSQELAMEFKNWFIAQEVQWTDARDQKVHNLRIRADLPDDVRARQRFMPKLRTPAAQRLRDYNLFGNSMKIGANGFRN